MPKLMMNPMATIHACVYLLDMLQHGHSGWQYWSILRIFVGRSSSGCAPSGIRTLGWWTPPSTVWSMPSTASWKKIKEQFILGKISLSQSHASTYSFGFGITDTFVTYHNLSSREVANWFPCCIFHDFAWFVICNSILLHSNIRAVFMSLQIVLGKVCSSKGRFN